MTISVVTGANRGIGLELCRLLQQRGDHVFAVCRTATPELEMPGVQTVSGIDIATDDGVAKLAAALAGLSVDLLINNAGILRRDTLEMLDFEAMVEEYQVNALGPLRVTRALLSNLHEGSKVAIITSRVGSIEDNASGDNYGYRMSKAAANMAGVNLHLDLAPRGVSVILLHPGYVATDMTAGNGVSPVQAAQGLVARIDALDAASSGTFRHAEGHRLPW